MSDVEPKRRFRIRGLLVLWVRLLWYDRRLVRNFTLFGLLCALLLALLLPHRYESRVRLMPPVQTSKSGVAMLAALARHRSSESSESASSGFVGNISGNLAGVKSSGPLFMDILRGPTIQDAVIQKFDLKKVYRALYWQDARKELSNRTEVKQDRLTGVITITVSDRDPNRAQQMAQAYVDLLNERLSEVSSSAAKRERIFLEARLRTLKSQLDNAAQGFSDFASTNATYDLPSQNEVMLNTAATLQQQLTSAQAELQGLKEVYRDENIRTRTLAARVAALEREVENVSGNKADLSSNDSQIPGDFPSIRKLALVDVPWSELRRDRKMKEAVYEALRQEYEVARIQEAKEIPAVNVLDAPTLPERKSFPPRILITASGTLFAFFLGSTVVTGSRAWKQNHSPEKELTREICAQLLIENSRLQQVSHWVRSAFWTRNRDSGAKSA